MILFGIETNKQEVESLRGFIPGEPGAILLGKIIFKLEQEGLRMLRDRGQTLEAMRYAQGFIDSVEQFENIARGMLGVDLERAEQAEDEIVMEEEAPDVAY